MTSFKINWKKFAALSMAVITAFSLTACSSDDDETESTDETTITTIDSSDMFTNNDLNSDYDASECTAITLSGDSASCSGSGVSISGSTVTISSDGSYIISGSLTNGKIIVDSDSSSKIWLILNGVDINCDTSASIYVKQADKVFITLADGTENTLSNTSDFVDIDENSIDGVIFSKDDITFNGSGSLTVTAAYGHGIVGKDDLVITGGSYTITSAKKGISANDSIRIVNATVSISSGTDSLHAENSDDASLGYIYIESGTFTLVSSQDALDASSIIQIEGGTFDITTGGGSSNASTNTDGSINSDWGSWSPGTGGGGQIGGGMGGMGGMGGKGGLMSSTDDSLTVTQLSSDDSSDDSSDSTSAKGIKADSNIIINGGEFTIDSSDDSIHSNGDIQIAGGTFEIASGDDGIHADSTVKIDSGTINITQSYEGIEGQNIYINGGTIDLVASDDGMNAAGGSDQSSASGRPGANSFNSSEDASINIAGGVININASGDGIDSNGTIVITGGETYVSGPTSSADGALDYEASATISGGIVVAVGAVGMAENFSSSSTQGAMLVSASGSAGDVITLKDSSGNELVTYTTEKTYSCVIISCPEITSGSTYTLVYGSNQTSVTMSSLVYSDTSGGMGGMGGMR